MAKMGDSELRAMLASQHADALAATNASKLSMGRADAQAYYNGDMSKDMPSAAGRSSAVSMDVSDTIEGMMPQLMEVFTGSDEVVRFDPVGPEDVEPAKQETDYINHVFMNQNPGFLILYSFIKDALLSKVGVVKVWWEEREEEQRETYLDKTDDEYALIVSNPDIEVIEHSEHPAGEPGDTSESPEEPTQPPMQAGQANAPQQPQAPNAQPGLQPPMGMQPMMPPPPMLHDVVVVMKKTYAQAKVLGVPPEEFGIERGARNIRDCNYCFHKLTDKTVAQLITQGYDEDQVKRLPTYRAWTNAEEINRDTVDESATAGSEELNDSARTVEIVEHYVRMDYKGNGKPCLYRVTTGGSGGEGVILKRDGKADIIEFDAIPFSAITPIIVTHRFFGRSVADLVMDIQRIKTALLRGLLDNTYMVNNPRTEISESHASDNTLDDLLVSRPNGIVRTKAPGGLNVLQTPSIAATVYPALEYFDATREWRTGVTRQGQGIDANALQNQSATAVNQAFTAAQARIRLIARIFAETGIRDLFWLLHATIKKHGDKQQIVRLRNQWVPVDPREWKSRDDLTVSVGLGTGSKAERVQHLVQIASMQKDALINGLTNLVTPENLYNTAKEISKLLGAPDTDTFFTDPKTQPPPQQKPDPKLQEIQLKAQLEQQALQAKSQIEQQKIQTDAAHQQMKTQADIALAERKAQLQEQMMMLDAQIKREQHQHDIARQSQLHDATMRQSEFNYGAAQQAHEAKMAQAKSKPRQPSA